MSLIVIAAETITIGILYRTAFEEGRLRLEETAKSQTRLIEAVAHFDKTYCSDYPFGTLQATLSQIRDAHSQYRGFGKTGEFTLSTRKNDQIIFLLNHRHYDLDNPKPVPWDSKLAEPMRLALSGRSGTMIGLDYRGELVLAAHEPLPELNLGIVAKIDLWEIKAPFIRAFFLIGIITIIAISAVAIIFIKITDPVLTELDDTASELEKKVQEVKTLKGIIPICSFCKKVRDDKGYWEQLEVFLSQHTDADLSHGVCPDCMAKHYPDIDTR